ncbi:hypothetical protein K438DRAFT_1971988 [Mycena galopus ATCC 62051]|nr:hypothetical protein K438DRAFT_1971988 [Mycena galopus ATCC 62051]
MIAPRFEAITLQDGGTPSRFRILRIYADWGDLHASRNSIALIYVIARNLAAVQITQGVRENGTQDMETIQTASLACNHATASLLNNLHNILQDSPVPVDSRARTSCSSSSQTTATDLHPHVQLNLYLSFFEIRIRNDMGMVSSAYLNYTYAAAQEGSLMLQQITIRAELVHVGSSPSLLYDTHSATFVANDGFLTVHASIVSFDLVAVVGGTTYESLDNSQLFTGC